MRSALYHFFRPTQEDFKRLWQNAVITYDASVLLNIYGYSDNTRSELIGEIQRYAERSWLPYQFALEYARNRASVIVRQIGNYQKTEADFKKIDDDRLRPKTEHPFLSGDSMDALNLIRKELAEKRKRFESMISSDQYADILLTAFNGRIGPPPTPDVLDGLHSIADARFKASVPPGYKDLKTKATPEAYGDFIAWRQIMDFARERATDIIVVTDDVKEDWWQIDHERTIGPRPEIIEEFGKETSRQVWLYTSEGFLRAAKEYDSSAIKDEVIQEVRAHLDAQSAAAITARGVKASVSSLSTRDEEPDRLRTAAIEPTKLTLPRIELSGEADIKTRRDDGDDQDV